MNSRIENIQLRENPFENKGKKLGEIHILFLSTFSKIVCTEVKR